LTEESAGMRVAAVLPKPGQPGLQKGDPIVEIEGCSTTAEMTESQAPDEKPKKQTRRGGQNKRIGHSAGQPEMPAAYDYGAPAYGYQMAPAYGYHQAPAGYAPVPQLVHDYAAPQAAQAMQYGYSVAATPSYGSHSPAPVAYGQPSVLGYSGYAFAPGYGAPTLVYEQANRADVSSRPDTEDGFGTGN